MLNKNIHIEILGNDCLTLALSLVLQDRTLAQGPQPIDMSYLVGYRWIQLSIVHSDRGY